MPGKNPPCIRIMSWNVGGAKFLKEKEDQRLEFREQLNRHVRDFASGPDAPDFILLQEIVQFDQDGQRRELIDAPPGYCYDASISISTVSQSHPTKWKPYRKQGEWSQQQFLAQGCGVLWRENIGHSSLWDFHVKKGMPLSKEIIRIDTGLYTGDRDTEPRILVVAHFVLDYNNLPLDLFLVNLHLTTLRGEREGLPARDDEGSERRREQVDLILNGIVSRYNEWRNRNLETISPTPRHPVIWVLAGDFNCLPDAPEIRKLERMNFIDLNPNKGGGTKGKGFPVETATIAVDYIFAGPAYYALDPFQVRQAAAQNPLPFYYVKLSDHFPLMAKLPLVLPS